MSELMKKSLKDISQELNIIQNKKREIAKKFDIESKIKIFEEIKSSKQKAQNIVNITYKFS